MYSGRAGIGDVTNLSKIKSGGFARVYSGIYQGEKVAVKILYLSPSNVLQNSKAQLLAALTNEIQILKMFKIHNHIVQFIDEYVNGYIMELMQVFDLKTYLQKNTVPDNRKLSYMLQIAAGIKALHLKDIIHCDLKCENVLVGFDGQLKLADFGLAQSVANSATVVNRYGGKLYKAPELFFHYTASKASDMYAFGMICWEIYSGLEIWPHLLNPYTLRVELARKSSPFYFDGSLRNPAMVLLVFALCRPNPSDRMSASAVLHRLKKLNKNSESMALSNAYIDELLENKWFLEVQACLSAAILDENESLLRFMLSDPKFKSEWLLQPLQPHEPSPIILAIQTGNPRISLLILEHITQTHCVSDDVKRDLIELALMQRMHAVIKNILLSGSGPKLAEANGELLMLQGLTALPQAIKLEDRIGKGAFSEVFRAIFRRRMVAVKYLTLQTHLAVQCLRTEIEILTSLPKHKNIIEMIEPCHKGFIMELAEIGNLRETLKFHKEGSICISMLRRMDFAKQILEGVYHLHRHDIVHDDLKEENILIKIDYQICLSDFGLSKKLNGNKTVKSNIGSILNFAPEKVFLESASTASDIYAVAMIFWALQMGVQAKSSLNSLAELKNFLINKRRPSLVNPEFDDIHFSLLIFSMWREDPADRKSALEASCRLAQIHGQSLLNNKVKMPTDFFAQYLYAAIKDNNFEMLTLLCSHPDFQSEHLSHHFEMPDSKLISPFLEAIRLQQDQQVLFFLKHAKTPQNLLLLKDHFSPHHAFAEIAASGSLTLLKKALQLADQTLFQSLFSNQDQVWMKRIVMENSELNQQKLNVSHFQKVILLITEHSFFTIDHFQILCDHQATTEIPDFSPLSGTLYCILYRILEMYANYNPMNLLTRFHSADVHCARTILHNKQNNLEMICQALVDYAEHRTTSGNGQSNGHDMQTAIELAKGELHRRAQCAQPGITLI